MYGNGAAVLPLAPGRRRLLGKGAGVLSPRPGVMRRLSRVSNRRKELNMRKFKCDGCGHEFEIPHGVGGKGKDMKCPTCGGPVHRADDAGPARGRGACGATPGKGPGRWLPKGRGAK